MIFGVYQYLCFPFYLLCYSWSDPSWFFNKTVSLVWVNKETLLLDLCGVNHASWALLLKLNLHLVELLCRLSETHSKGFPSIGSETLSSIKCLENKAKGQWQIFLRGLIQFLQIYILQKFVWSVFHLWSCLPVLCFWLFTQSSSATGNRLILWTHYRKE